MEKGIDKHISEEEEKQEKKKLQKESLDKAMKEKIDPVLNDMMHKYLGVEITELKHDLSDKLKKP